MMLHKNLMVAWDSFPPQLTITLAGHIGDDEYMAFGISGEQVTIVIVIIVVMMIVILVQGKSVMTGGDVVVAYMDEYLGHADDYNLTARSVCHTVLGQRGGACHDELLGGDDVRDGQHSCQLDIQELTVLSFMQPPRRMELLRSLTGVAIEF